MHITRRMKSLRILTFAAIALVLAPALFAADFGIRAGRYNDGDEDFVGAELLFDLGALNINPNVEYLIDAGDDVTAGTANLDVTFDVASIGTLVPYLGAGVGLSYADTPFGSNTDVIGNLIGGVNFRFGTLTPYAQVKYFRLIEDDAGGDNDDLALTIGLRF